jgi:pilus assembly protein CpaE
MSRRIAAIVAHDDSISQDLLSAHIPTGTGIEVVSVLERLVLTTDDIRRSDADVLIIVCREHSVDGLALCEWWHNVRPGRPVVVLSEGGDEIFVERVFAAGADDFIVISPYLEAAVKTRSDLEFAIRKAVARNYTGGERAPDSGTLLAVLGPKGGSGKTVTSTNLAVALATRGRRTALIDLDLHFGDVALSLDLNPHLTSFDLAVSGGSLDGEKLDDFMLRHPSGLRVLAAPVKPDQASSVSPGLMLDVYSLLRREYDFVIVDTPPSFTPEVIATIDNASALCLVVMLDALSLKNARLGLETLDLMGFPEDKVRILLSRAGTSVGVSESDAVEIMGRPLDVLVPSDRSVSRSLGDGVPLVISQPKSEVAKAYEALADLFSAPVLDEVVAEAKPRRAWGRRRKREDGPETTLATLGQSKL